MALSKKNAPATDIARPRITRRITEATRQANRERLARARQVLAAKVSANRPAYVPDGHKFCGRCGFIKFRGSFSNHRNMKDGKQTVCKDCTTGIPTRPGDPDVWTPGEPEVSPMAAETYVEPRRSKEEMAMLRLEYQGMHNGTTITTNVSDDHAAGSRPVSTIQPYKNAPPVPALPAQAMPNANGTNPMAYVYKPKPADVMASIGSNELVRPSAIVHAILDGQRLQITLAGGNVIIINGERGVDTYRWLCKDVDVVGGGQTEIEQLRAKIVELESQVRQRENAIAAQRRDVDAAMELASGATQSYNELIDKLGPLAEAIKAVKISPISS